MVPQVKFAAWVVATLAAALCAGRAVAQSPEASRSTSQSHGIEEVSGAPTPRHLLSIAADEDWGFLADPTQRTDPWDVIKYIPLGRGGAYLSLGGEVRAYYEGFYDEAFGQIPGSSQYGETRVLFHFDVHLDDHFRFFVNFQSDYIGPRPGGPRPTIDRDDFDLLEGFVEWRTNGVDENLQATRFAIRLGRQQFEFGSGRLFSSRASVYGEGPNVLQGFDGIRAIWRAGPWRTDVFAVRPAENNVGVFDDGEMHGQGAWGIYATHDGLPGFPSSAFDLYYIGADRPAAAFFSGIGYEQRHTVGARVFRTAVPFDYDVESFYQFGRNGGREIEAWGFGSQAGWTFLDLPWSPRTGAQFGINSGGGNGGILRDESPPFPRGVYFGNLRAVGPENTFAAQGELDLHPAKSVTLTGGAFFFWRTTLDDGIYTQGGMPIIAPTNRERYVGYQPFFSVRWQVTSRLVLSAAYETFQKGDFLRHSPEARATDYTAAWATFRF